MDNNGCEIIAVYNAMRKASDGKYELFNFDTEREETEEVENLRERFTEERIVPLSVHCISK